MEAAWIDQIWHSVVALSIGMARIIIILIVVPVFKGLQLKGMVRNSCAMALALILLPYIQPNLYPSGNVGGLGTALLLLKETAIGFFIGTLLAIPFWMFDWMGVMIDSQRGALNGSVFNPALGSDSLIGGLIKQSVILILLISGGIPLLLEVLWQSYLVWPPYELLPLDAFANHQLLELWLDQLTRLFNAMILYAAPVVACLLFVDFSMGVLGLFSPHLQVSVLAMPVKSLLGLALIVIYLPQLWQHASDELQQLKYLTSFWTLP